ncbi:DUF2536 family protein [Jeotgalibacillus sp. S-D1]|uniref:DUF2536 family protein n=1 Tax=Jeotgalibacillus sp. S-D1 TaxID=2552189 RepID=UPI0010594B9A|nr:DUF2536 family protein [Jeotgalibacillus sp. S-D1]TDL34467.1 DUF2536 family protein [Jeotgalibacillus sp. S-D1]
MSFQIDILQDKVEFYESHSLQDLEKKIQIKIDQNRAIMLQVHAVSHQVAIDEKGRPHYTASVHYKAK